MTISFPPKSLMLFLVTFSLAVCAIGKADESATDQFLMKGELEKGAAALNETLSKNPDNDQARFELGVIQFFQTIEHLGQSLYEFGPQDSFTAGMIPFLRMPVPKNPDPKPVELVDIRRMFERALADLTETDNTLAKVTSADVKLPLHVFLVHLDFNKDGKATNDEEIQPILRRYLGQRRGNDVDLSGVVIAFDRSDVAWLRGYCCLLKSMCETFLAYDHSLAWDVVAQRFFKRGIVKYDFLREEENGNNIWTNQNLMLDLIAGIHNLRFPLKQPARLKKAHQYLLETIGHSRNMWALVNAETDNDREWIPSPSQTTPITNVPITRQMTESWGEFLTEAEALLKGEKLIPFWRGTNPKRGINLRKIFYQPTDMDVVLWIHGSGMVPFLEMGECTSVETWREFQDVFRGEFFGFAIWFN